MVFIIIINIITSSVNTMCFSHPPINLQTNTKPRTMINKIRNIATSITQLTLSEWLFLQYI